MPSESQEVTDVDSFGEIRPPRPDRTGEGWRIWHTAGMTETGYTSWSVDRSIAEAAAEACADSEDLGGGIKILRVRIRTLDQGRLYEGRADEDEWLIEGNVENVMSSDDPMDAENDE